MLTGRQPQVRPPVRRVVVFVTVALALLMMSVDTTIVATALHILQRGLHTSINWAGWTITAYSFGFVLMLPISGRLSERFGRKKVFLASTIAFTIASLLCGLAGNISQLIALRALQAAGGAGFTPSATGIVVDYFGDARDRAVSLFGSIFPIGAMIGPIFGGLFVTYLSWRAVFLVNVPLGIAVIVLSLIYIPRDRDQMRAPRTKMDPMGMALLGTGLLAGMAAIAYVGELGSGMRPALLVLPAAASVIAFWWFFRHINRSSHPFIDPVFIYGRRFGAVNLVNAVFSGIRSGVIALVPLYAANRYGIGALGAGTLLIAQGVAAIMLSFSAAMLLRRTGHRPPIYVGAVAVIAGVALLAIGPPGTVSPYGWLAVSTFVIGAGSGAMNPASRNAGLQLAPDSSSTLAAIRTTSLQIGSITTVSTVTAILTVAADPGAGQAVVYGCIAALLAICLPLIHRIPEHHGRW
ncbi:MFS transporter [Spelaeicoccus albus]|uniref:EmrB/QacA subfamily drug resistance transporter n=1 Tax=Spelaeicoccus albus TaxID=1280376 RepID=A0A7Z0D4B7_9MICO|nr:MFS transporter [Spelaeicoccus albus]NYI68638.1 EmrB/QacA subfamily drug resistance transporter [Spelaeicoccus albus]